MKKMLSLRPSANPLELEATASLQLSQVYPGGARTKAASTIALAERVTASRRRAPEAAFGCVRMVRLKFAAGS